MTKYAEYWTPTARDCYERGCICEGCIIKKTLESPCYMKKAVLELVRKYGKPPEKEKTLNKTQQEIIKAILEGCNTMQEIAKMINKSEAITQNNLNQLYVIAEADGVVFLTRIKLNQFIRYIRGSYEQ